MMHLTFVCSLSFEAQTGIGLSVVIILTAVSVILVTIFAAIGICSRCQMERGGVYFIISHVLGARIGGSVGVLYCFGQVSVTLNRQPWYSLLSLSTLCLRRLVLQFK